MKIKYKDVHQYWEKRETESMYDKHLLSLEMDVIAGHIGADDLVLDAGCGEGEGTLLYASLCKELVAADFSQTRLQLAAECLKELDNVTFLHADLNSDDSLTSYQFDSIISQRFLINILEEAVQYRIISQFFRLLKPGGKLILLEGFLKGTNALNEARKQFGLNSIPVKWHNNFFEDDLFTNKVTRMGFEIISERDFSTYFLSTRVLGAYLVHPEIPTWDCKLNRNAAAADQASPSSGISRLKMYVLQKPAKP